MAAPDRVALAPRDRHPGETAFVLVRPGPDDAWTYLGVGRWRVDGWAVPPPTWRLWKRLSTGRGASRTLDDAWLARAEAVAAELVARFAGETVLVRGRPVRVLGRSAQGGVRIVGEGGQERSVSRTDLAWALAAADDVRVSGGALDEARVNRLRYLDETPKGSTRWIDTGWAVGLVGVVAGP
jgi:hypothetical protein